MTDGWFCRLLKRVFDVDPAIIGGLILLSVALGSLLSVADLLFFY